MATQNQDRLRSHFAALDPTSSSQSTGWDSLWETSSFLPWDRGHANPALIDLLSSSLLPPAPTPPPAASQQNPTPGAPALDARVEGVQLPRPVEGGKRKRALVPGCGTGYDVALFAAYGYEATGLEVSAHAGQAAGKYLAGAGQEKGNFESEYEGKDAGQGRGGARCVVGDFFEDAWVSEAGVEVGEGGGFDVIYDNTFLCALPPSLRPAWASRIAALLAKDGVLICLEFPTHKPASSGGPPWSLPPTVHSELLKQPGAEIAYDEGGVVVASERGEGPGALRRVAHYVPARTHDVGVVKGVVRDSVSVWRHV
ncbi:S-adenosyl-L-methionine-dependent methyltransferase [Boeremia exigua]|uniref:S-adenosyl-L-methionine-dependent methyltransferase n=1 Tax=Boeremia exigua TaxID=749465 RepID=UPI001E8EF2C4|nr:S-adenosyl-L-methionine-dependent methyltransferase [Boeremia exigua]KAH6621852.1 S-adenosyl-L-methionine-dependent methyltransferase [Boeremia exigua]